MLIYYGFNPNEFILPYNYVFKATMLKNDSLYNNMYSEALLF